MTGQRDNVRDVIEAADDGFEVLQCGRGGKKKCMDVFKPCCIFVERESEGESSGVKLPSQDNLNFGWCSFCL